MGDPDIDLAHFEQRLLEMRAELEAAGEAGDGAAGVVELDQSRVGRLSRMDALQAQAMSAESRRRRQLRARAIEAALARIGNGEYGWCPDCGETVDLRRLEFDPAAELCVRCAEKGEE